jgi:hypothetical protein
MVSIPIPDGSKAWGPVLPRIFQIYPERSSPDISDIADICPRFLKSSPPRTFAVQVFRGAKVLCLGKEEKYIGFQWNIASLRQWACALLRMLCSAVSRIARPSLEPMKTTK